MMATSQAVRFLGENSDMSSSSGCIWIVVGPLILSFGSFNLHHNENLNILITIVNRICSIFSHSLVDHLGHLLWALFITFMICHLLPVLLLVYLVSENNLMCTQVYTFEIFKNQF